MPRQRKILAVASAVDLDFRYGCTPAWWQLFKGLYEGGVDLIVTPYRGPAVESPWWRVYDNPCYREGEAFAATQRLVARLKGDTHPRRAESSPEDRLVDQAVRKAVAAWVTPRWERHIARILERERDVEAVVVFTVPMSHLRGVPAALRARYDVPFVYYDGDVPMSLPEFGGMDTGFNIYHGADPGEYDIVLANSEGGLGRLRELGARRTAPLFWAADPELFFPEDVPKIRDVFFYGYGEKFRADWMEAMLTEPSRRLPDARFAVGGLDFRSDLGRTERIGDVPFNRFRRTVSESRINLCITRRPHATLYASSSCRPFELAAAGCAIVANPYEGIERWFEPGRELIVVSGADEAEAAYRELLADEQLALELGARARQRVVEEHTYRHRAAELLALVDSLAGAPVEARA
jgi:spore maturation protein CgeB